MTQRKITFMLRFCVVIGLLFAAACGGGGGATSTPAPVPTSLPPTVTQSSLTCDQVIAAALDSVGTTCASMKRNQACYGHDRIQVEFQPNERGEFDTTGDVVDLLAIKSLTTTPVDETASIFGVAVIKAQVNLPETIAGQSVTFLLFGEASLDGVTPDMRVFSLSTGIGEPQCKGAPPSSMLVQSPQGTEVAMNINGAEVTVGSTLYVTAQQQREMRIATIEGLATVRSNNVTQTVQPGAQVRLQLGGANGLEVTGPPSPPEPFEAEEIVRAPLTALERPVQIPPTIMPQEFATPEVTPEISPTPGGANFRADQTRISAGSCTNIYWDVSNAKTVYFQGQPTRASNTRQVCPTSTITYTLLVIRADDTQEFYNLTINVES